jgi:hypothetical protein
MQRWLAALVANSQIVEGGGPCVYRKVRPPALWAFFQKASAQQKAMKTFHIHDQRD